MFIFSDGWFHVGVWGHRTDIGIFGLWQRLGTLIWWGGGGGGVGDRDREHSSFRGVMACDRDFWLIWLIRRGGIMPICTGGIGSPVQHAKRQSTVDSLQKWTMFFHKKNMYSDIPDVLHLALCLQKSKQPAPKKTVYEVQDTWMALQSSVI